MHCGLHRDCGGVYRCAASDFGPNIVIVIYIYMFFFSRISIKNKEDHCIKCCVLVVLPVCGDIGDY